MTVSTQTPAADSAPGHGSAAGAPAESTPRTPEAKPAVPVADRAFAIVAHVVLGIWTLLVLLPLLWMIYTSFKSSQEILTSPFGLPETLRLDNYTRAWREAQIGEYLWNTVVVVGVALFLVMALGAMCSYVLARFSFPGNRIIYYSLIAGLTFPIFLAVIPLFFVLNGMGLIGKGPMGLVGVILAYVAFALPFTVFFLYAFFRSLPEEIAEAAAIDGAGDFRTFFQVMLPMAWPGIVSVAIFNFLGLWNQYLLPLVLNTDRDNYVLAQGLVNLQAQQGYRTDWGGMFASVVITVIPVLLVYVLFQRQIQAGVSPSTNK